ncbi:ROK family protein [Clostridium oryzae]|uniref:ROK family protein n=1 Tax=Clostridium oryzae TaxID=1450648 RepID=A0A1V4IU95_9CLOT|nr:ROK family protein [Clostridium oryzae]OPJ63017.1 ROK family protein [Clostridium oryzae]
MLKANRAQMKEINKNILRQVLKERRKATKPELSALTKLSVVTVNSLISEMISSNEVIEGDEVPSNGGRPSKQYVYNGNYRKAIIIYGHQNNNQNLFHMLIINSLGECIERKKGYYENIVIDSFDMWIETAFKTYENICSIVFGLPGAEENGVIYVHDYSGIVGDKFLAYYQVKYHVPVLYENDINATVYGFYARQNTKTVQTVVGLYYPRIYGPGAGAVIKGEIYKGCKNFAGEVNWIPLKPSWNEVNYDNPEEIVLMLSHIAIVYSCVLAPERIVFYGDFLTDKILEKLITRLQELLKGNFLPYIQFEKNLIKDFEWGMIQIALGELKRKEGIAEWY